MADILLGWPQSPRATAPGFVRDTAAATGAARPAGPIADDTESHCLVVAPTGAGKGRGLVLPNLLHWPHSAIVVDIKGEAARTTARWRRALGQPVVVLDPFERVGPAVDGLNPLDWLKREPAHFADNATSLAESLMGSERSHKEPFWDLTALDLSAGLIAYAASREGEARRSMQHVYDLLTADDMPFEIATLLDTVRDMPPFAHRQLAAFLMHEPEKVRPSVRSTAQQHLRLFANPSVQRVVRHSSVDLDALQRGDPMTIYLVLPATRLASHAGLLRLWLTVLLGCIAERTQQPRGPTLLVVDEFAQIGALPMLLQALTLLRGYGLRAMLVLQSMAQLRSMFPTQHQAIVDNCGTLVAFGQNRPAMATPMAEVLGDISANALMQMGPHEVAINRAGSGTTIARRLDYLHDPLFAGRFDLNPFYDAPAHEAAPA